MGGWGYSLIALGTNRGLEPFDLSQVWKSLETGRWLEEEPYEMADEFPAARVSVQTWLLRFPMYLSSNRVPLYLVDVSSGKAAVWSSLSSHFLFVSRIHFYFQYLFPIIPRFGAACLIGWRQSKPRTRILNLF